MKTILTAIVASVVLVTGMVEAATIQLPKTGQTLCWDANNAPVACAATGQDGALQTGVTWPEPRFIDNGNGTISDKLTGLIWLKNANCFGQQLWQSALTSAKSLASPACGLTDNSKAGDWRLPNTRDLVSLNNDGVPSLLAWLTAQGFDGIQDNYYWSSTSLPPPDAQAAWFVYTGDGSTSFDFKDYNANNDPLEIDDPTASQHYVWAVRTDKPGVPAVAVSPVANDFGSVAIGGSSPKTFTLSNTGMGSLGVSSITLSGGSTSQFSLNLGNGAGGSCGPAPISINAGESCTISAAFAPTSLGLKATSLRIASNDPLALVKLLPLSGTGILPSYTIGTAITNGSGSVTCDSPVIQGGSSVCTVTPEVDFKLETFSDDGVDKLLFVNINNSYTIKNVTAGHTISASFSQSPASSSHIVINNGATTTKNPSVTLTLTCNGAASMQFLIDKAAAWTPLMPFAAKKIVMLPAGNGSKTVAVRFLDTNGNTTAIYNASIFLDAAPPVGSITINSGAATTPSKDLSLTLSASDSYGGTLQMRLSEDGISWNNSSWVPYAASPTYTLGTLPVKTTITPGLKRVYVQFRDESGKISRLYSDTINYLGPTVATTPSNIAINGSATHTVSAAVSLTLTAPAGEAFVRLSNNGITYGSWLPMTTSPLTKGWTLPAGDGVKTVYAQYSNDKKIPVTTYSATIILDTVAPAGWLLINNGAAVTSGTTVNLTMGATDVNGVASMCINEATPICGPADFVAYGESLSGYPITPTDGVKKIYITFKDNAGKVSTPVSASVILDSTQLAGTVLINGGSPTTTSAAVTLKITATKAVHMQISVDNGLTWSDWEPYVVTKKVTLPAGAGERIVVVRFRDFAGNQSPNSSDSITLAP